MLAAALTAAPDARAVDLPFQKTTLSNGLTVIVHEDHTLPRVAVNVLYRVGSQDEEPHRTGFAHLFEHLMFMGTARAPTGKFDRWLEASGGFSNAETSSDLTDYFEESPAPALPLLLWLEADRLEALGQQIDRGKLNLQRDVVQQERRQTSENEPYGVVELRLPELLYPEGHPYHHPVIGSHEDLEAAQVKDVQEFFAKYYVPANATLCVAGDVKPDDVNQLARQYFGNIPGGARPVRHGIEAPVSLGKVIRETLEDHVELAKIVMAFPSPAHLEPGDADLDLLAHVLAVGRASRLSKALIYDRSLARSVEVHQHSQEISSYFTVEVTAQPGVNLDELEKATDAVLTSAVTTAPTDSELHQAQNEFEMSFVQGLQDLLARAALLNGYEVEKGDPGYLKKDMDRYRNATSASVLDWAKKTLTLGSRVVIRVIPKAGKVSP